VGRMSGEIYAAQTRALLGRPDAGEVLRGLACPTLVLCGMQDGWSPPDRRLRPHGNDGAAGGGAGRHARMAGEGTIRCRT
jgi:pimeloyl-ACP methyl ester carboxylesterase